MHLWALVNTWRAASLSSPKIKTANRRHWLLKPFSVTASASWKLNNGATLRTICSRKFSQRGLQGKLFWHNLVTGLLASFVSWSEKHVRKLIKIASVKLQAFSSLKKNFPAQHCYLVLKSSCSHWKIGSSAWGSTALASRLMITSDCRLKLLCTISFVSPSFL